MLFECSLNFAQVGFCVKVRNKNRLQKKIEPVKLQVS